MSFNSSTKSTIFDSTHTPLKSSASSRPVLFGTPKAPAASSLSVPKPKSRPRNVFEEDGDRDSSHDSPSLKRRKRLADSPSPPSSPLLTRATSEEQELAEVIEVQADARTVDKKVSRPSRGHKPSRKKVENTLVEPSESSQTLTSD